MRPLPKLPRLRKKEGWGVMPPPKPRHCFALAGAALGLAGCVVAPVCPVGRWVSPVTLTSVADPVPGAASRPVVLLGEEHDNAADHRWELATIAALARLRPVLVLGFEMFPRRAQGVLDRWVAGGLSEAAFLREAGWHDFWGFDPALYWPIFRFARDRHIPMRALNVSRALVHRVAQRGWDAVPEAEREGVTRPAAPSAAYRASLADAMAGHGGTAMTPARLEHFIEAQTVWDAAMAQAIAAQRAREPARLVVGVMGAGHLEDREGVPHQLAVLGIADSAVLLPSHGDCTPHDSNFADAIYVDANRHPGSRP